MPKKSVQKSSKKLTKSQSCKKKVSTARMQAHRILNELNAQKAIRVFVAGGSRSGSNPEYAQEAFLLGQAIGRRDYQLAFGLSSRGIMGAVAEGVLSEWKKRDKKLTKPILGVTTEHYQKLYPDDTLLDELTDIIVSHTLEERKQNLLSADFVVFAPGGLGTLDELVYDCIAMQDGLLKAKPFILFNTDGFFHHLLEYLKDIHLKGFSDRIPFIVVDDLFEMDVAFDMISFYRKEIKNKKEALEIVDKIIHELPYAIEQLKKGKAKSVRQLLKTKNHILSTTDFEPKRILFREIETAYLNKEIDRMNERLIATSRDTALVSHKLDELRRQMKETGM